MIEQHINQNSMLSIGSILRGIYRIDRYLSSGGFGNTYVATNVEFDEVVAIKEFFIKGVTERDANNTTVSVSNSENKNLFEEQLQKFKKEARRLRKLKSPHIVSVHDLFEENGTAYYVMDYIDGENLSVRLKRLQQPLSEKEVMGYLPQILEALKCVHEDKLYHLDLKPANIMVDRQGNVTLIDFGASKQYSNKDGMTTSTAVSYTNGFAPREQMEQNMDKFGPWTDLYALGATLYNLLTNKKPPLPSDIDDDRSTDKHLALPMPQNVSEKTKQIILWLMRTDRIDRPQSVAALRSMMVQYDDDSHTFVLPTTTNDTPNVIEENTKVMGIIPSSNEKIGTPINNDEKPYNSRKWLYGVIGALMIVLAGVAYIVIKNNQRHAVEVREQLLRDSIEQAKKDSITQIESVKTELVDSLDIKQEEEQNKLKQFKTTIINENYVGNKYYYNIQVNDGKLNYSYNADGKGSEIINCNPDVSADIIIAEFKGLVYWEIAAGLLFNMVEEINNFHYDQFEAVKNALGKSVSFLSKARNNCPNAFKKAQQMYSDLINAENGDNSWEIISRKSFEMGEYELSVCDIYF